MWQATNSVTTTFTLDLNTALTQVLAQSQSGGPAARFLPGVGQQVNGLWYYYHADALGSVRQMTGPTGASIGSVTYSPFGEIVDSTGLLPLFGFTGRPQESGSGLTYLRSRYYNPALGRFLTPDSLIPDVSNGQALNVYAYVYNDPVNMVDPGGNIPIPPVPPVNLPNIPWKTMAVATARGGLNILDWWNRPPEQCDCQGQSSKIVGFLGLGPQAAWAYASEPAARYGTKVVENLVGTKQVPGLWRRLPLLRSLPGKWGYKTVQIWEASPPVSGYLDELVPRGMPRGNGLHYTGSNSRYTLNTKLVPEWGWKGVGGTIALAGIIDGVFQFASDSANPCFAWGQRFNRAAVATIFGMVAGAAGAAAFAVTVALTAPAWAVIGVSFAVGAGVGYFLAPYKEKMFSGNPQYFGY